MKAGIANTENNGHHCFSESIVYKIRQRPGHGPWGESADFSPNSSEKAWALLCFYYQPLKLSEF